MDQLVSLSLDTALRNLSWIKRDLNSGAWSLREKDQLDEFNIVVDDIAEKFAEINHNHNLWRARD